jgi:two-component system cell cycle response regulator DivK
MRETVLVIEDNRLNMKLFYDLLLASSRKPIIAASGRDGIALANRYVPDLIVVDLQLPDGSGLDVIREIKGAAPQKFIPALATSAFQPRVNEQWLSRHQCDAFIAKPISAWGFLAEVARLIDGAVVGDRVPYAPPEQSHAQIP